MRRTRPLGLAAALALLAAPLAVAARAQPAAPPVVGILSLHSPEEAGRFVASLRRGLRERGYVEGESLVVLERYAQRRPDRLADLAAELVRLRADLIVTGGDLAVAAVKRATRTVPVVLGVMGGDPVGLGFVASLARPGGDLVGVTSALIELHARRLGLLREAVPRLTRVAVLANAAHPPGARTRAELTVAAHRLGLELGFFEAGDLPALERALTAMTRARMGAVLVMSDQMFFDLRDRVVALAEKSRLPATYPEPEFVTAGGLMAYSADLAEQVRRSAALVDAILRGARPADLSVEQPARHELAINLRTAAALGLTIPRSLLARADRVVR